MTSPPGPLSHLPPSHTPGEGERGYNLVMLMVIVTLLNVALAASLPLWSHVIQRDKEEELISRGFQYAEAIRLFKKKFNRTPVRLEELIEVKPRYLRRLWKDPMTEDGKWAIIPEGQSPMLTPQDLNNPDNGRNDDKEDDDSQEESPFGGKKGEEVMVGPLHGVHSRSGKKSILTFNGRERYDEWHFTMEMIPSADGNPEGNPAAQSMAAGIVPSYSIRWVGRPLPAFLQAPQIPNNPGFNNPPGIDPGKLGPRKPPQGQRQPPENQ